MRDDQGVYREAAQAIGRQVQSVIESELQGILLALQHSWTQDHRKMIIEGDGYPQ